MREYFQTIKKDFTLYLGDSVKVIEQLGSLKVDLIFADPPYFLSKGKSFCINGAWKEFDKGEWDRNRGWEYVNAFNREWLFACRKILKEDGTIFITGTYHNIFSVVSCLQELGYKLLNVIVWQKTDAKPTLSRNYFNFTTELIVWARKNEKGSHFFNCDLMECINGGVRMGDVWRFPFLASWEMKCGKHPTQKPLSLLYRVLLASTRIGETVFDPFAGSCTTGIAANLLGRTFIGIDQNSEYLDYGIRRRREIDDPLVACKYLKKMSENNEELMVMVNYARDGLRQKMIENGICYLRAGDAKGSLLIKPGFERLQYVLLHTNGENARLFRLKTRGHFQIWTQETLRNYGFCPTHAPYYIVLHFDNTKIIPLKNKVVLNEKNNTFCAKIRPLSDFLGLK